MPLQDKLKLVVDKLLHLRLDINNSNSKKSFELNSVQNIILSLIDESSIRISNTNCLDILEFLIYLVCDPDLTCCKNNFSYLAQREKLCCILKNLKTLLHQIHCFDLCNIKCKLLSKLLCLLLQIIEKIINTILYIITLEALCSDHKCSDETFQCVLCNLVKNIDDLEILVNELSCVLLEIASSQIINCTSCSNNTFTPKHYKFCDCDHHKCGCDYH